MKLKTRLFLFFLVLGIWLSERWLNNNTPGFAQSYFILPFIVLSLLSTKINFQDSFIKAIFAYLFIATSYFIFGGFEGFVLLTTIGGTVLICLSLLNIKYENFIKSDLMYFFIILTSISAIAYYLGFWIIRNEQFDNTRSTFMENNENTVAQQLCIGLSFILFVAFKRQHKIVRTLLLILAAFYIIPILSTISRTGISLMVITIFLYIYVKYKSSSNALLFFSFILGGGLIYFKVIDFENIKYFSIITERVDDASDDIRFELWDLGLKLAKENFFTGVGFGNYSNLDWRNTVSSNHSLGFDGFGSTHNSFLDLIHIGGISLLIAYITLIGYVLRNGIKMIRSESPETRTSGALVLSSIIGIIFFSQTAQASMDKLTWFLFAVCYVWINEAKRLKSI
jgi:O-antigen ligase